jgi:GT2 family glycosyltransferase
MNRRELAERVCIGITPLTFGPTAFFVGDEEGPGLMQLEHFNARRMPRPVTGQTAVHSLRNTLCETFLNKRSEPYLLFLDHDMMFPADLLVHVGGYREVAAISGAYFLRDLDRPLPVAFSFREDGTLRYLIKEFYEWLQEDERGLHRVDVVGAGCLAIHRRVLEAMGGDWFEGSIGAEDVHFCRRAKELGFPVYVDTRVTCRHLQQMGIGANWFLSWANREMAELAKDTMKTS